MLLCSVKHILQSCRVAEPDLPVIVIHGAVFDDFAGFVEEFSDGPLTMSTLPPGPC